MNEEGVIGLATLALTMDYIDPYLDYLYNIYPGCDYYRLAYLLARAMGPSVIVELGTQYARCAAHFAAGAPHAQVFTIDVVADHAREEPLSHYSNITFIHGRSELPETAARVGDGIDICFADSFHQTGHVLKEIALWTPKMRPGALWLIDDLREMPDLMGKLPFKVKGTLPGIHTTPVGSDRHIEEVGFGYAFVD